MARKTYGVVYDKDGWIIERHQLRGGGETFTIERVRDVEPRFCIAEVTLRPHYQLNLPTVPGATLPGDTVEVAFEPQPRLREHFGSPPPKLGGDT